MNMTYNLNFEKLLFFCCLILISCNNQDSKADNNSNKNFKSDENAQAPVVDVWDFEESVSTWNEAHNSKDIEVLRSLYDRSVLYYGTRLDKNSCIKDKQAFFKKYPKYRQQISGEIATEKISDTEIKCSFNKRVTFHERPGDYPSYVIFSKEKDNWKISTEGDLVTDRVKSRGKDVIESK
jgi:ketosteroid isomerase-like protein